MKSGSFIVFEGLDGSGRSTQLTLLKEYCVQHQLDPLFTYEPTDSEIGALVRRALQKKWETGFDALQLLFSADRAHHLKMEIEPALLSGKNVFCDRYVGSTLAFGGVHVNLGWLQEINKRFRQPDLTLFFDVSAKVCLERIVKRGGAPELFETSEYLQQVHENYKTLLEDQINTVFIDGTQTPEQVFALILKLLKARDLI